MQATKDSFYAALRDRLAQIDATCTVAIAGTTRPAVMVCENERAELSGQVNATYCLQWGAPKPAMVTKRRAVFAMPVTIEYATVGSDGNNGADRGRQLEAMDAKLREMLAPASTAKLDYTQSPAASLGTNVHWGAAEFKAAEQKTLRLVRQVVVTVYFYPEVCG